MKNYQFRIRGINNREIDAICPFPLEPDEFETRLDALIEEIGKIAIVVDVEREGSLIKIDFRETSNVEELKLKIITVLKTDSAKCLRIVSDVSEELGGN